MSLYRYFGEKTHLDAFLEEGEVYFNSLHYFQRCLGNSRHDESEGTNIYRPPSGLITNNQKTGRQFVLSDTQLNSKLIHDDQIFIFCFSTEYNALLRKKINAYGCVRVLDRNEFAKRIRVKFEEYANSQIWTDGGMLSGNVEYYDLSEPPGTRYAIPESIIFSKPNRFIDEKEFRFAIVPNKSWLEMDSLQFSLSAGTNVSDSKTDHLILNLGSLTDICEMKHERME